eukprot:TRINITY_DN68329_c0_g1_i1.p1 TRINITY_DN68329_c0_g1~~TRINITY_DN68329_c0_g1_i1.p1  ORF type:complete len:238 (-),score=40.42 TRINITY_DN68329_c0_g1_i1:15-728(-)
MAAAVSGWTADRTDYAGLGQYSTTHRERQKRTNIVCPDTGKLRNKTIISVESPDWMKSSFESNRAYFEKQGIQQQIKKEEGHAYAGRAAPRKLICTKRYNIVNKHTGVIQNKTIVSPAAPDWFKSAFESNRPYFEAKGIQQKLKGRQANATERSESAPASPSSGKKAPQSSSNSQAPRSRQKSEAPQERRSRHQSQSRQKEARRPPSSSGASVRTNSSAGTASKAPSDLAFKPPSRR